MKIELDNGMILSGTDSDGDELKTSHVHIEIGHKPEVNIRALINALEAMENR